MENEECFEPILSSEEEDNFQKLNTIPIVLIPWFFGVCILICGITFISLWSEEWYKCETYFIYLYFHCAYWLIVMTIDHVIKIKHHNLRINGYLEFYQSTYQLIRMPLFITSLWNTCYLFLVVILHHTHKDDYEQYCRTSKWIAPISYICFLSTLELVIVLAIYTSYMEKVMKFNQLRPPPDVTRDEWLSPFTQDSYSGMGEVGYRQRGRNLEELLEKQTDMIRYLKDHNVKLCHRIMLLTSQRRTTET
ncbi:transmembrane protein 192 [Pogonomyrmex barbatus]|uniref:Transmembrane protein 192 n=1 Tax=Pogonomyrmex barbatus TaxID=144034 RepID=A0A6I9WXZ2_9HYME|nr:transmembrane protein 192 [Pogonomyrmex barbatus]XP_011644922.1 transmembrane protein 192 [Pogonomyrmex barbatus]XP_011644923.1 transmembrane protein 192 [Pogonomyrmex barbatus]XP_011644924.1 transmembrane protein 192 [Pogonomyrmex barbatus]XP_011644925.1 transmembrane protein 192 [Pogonomyrmex barbatus]